MTIGYGDEAAHGLGVHCPLPWGGFIIPGVHLRTSPDASREATVPRSDLQKPCHSDVPRLLSKSNQPSL